MKRILSILIMLAASWSISAQRIATQQFMVRKITFQATDQIVPISGISVEINNAKFRSDKAGQFTANIPVASDMGFYISSISAPGYLVSIPEDLSKKLYLSSNETVIVLADINAVKAERDRIYNSNKAALAKQEERLNAEITKNQELLDRLKKQEAEYNTVLVELEIAKGRLESFNDAKPDLEGKIDSLSNYLSMLDYMSLSSAEQSRIDKEKAGEWIDVIVDEVISKLGASLHARRAKELNEFEKLILGISEDYYQRFIKDNQALAINYFAYHYYGFLREAVDNMRAKKEHVLDRILGKIIDEDLDEMLEEHVESCKNQWRSMGGEEESRSEIQESVRTLDSAKSDFLSWALYPDKKSAFRKVAKPRWSDSETDRGIVNTLKKAYPQYYAWCKEIADKAAAKYKDLTDDEVYKFAEVNLRTEVRMGITMSIWNLRAERWNDSSWPYYEFMRLMDDIAAEEALEPLQTKYNALIDVDRKRFEKMSFARIDTKIPAISAANLSKNTLTWEPGKYAEEYKEEYAKLSAEYPEYTAFLYSIVMQFMQPIFEKYDCDEALFLWKSSMEDDVNTYCFRAIQDYQDKLSYIPGVAGSGDKCADIVHAITEIEKEKIVECHNDRQEKYKKRAEDEEAAAIKRMKNNKTRFDSEDDIIAFLATHKFVIDESETSTWYDSKISKWYIDFGGRGGYYDISYTVVEWNRNSAKLKLTVLNGASFIVNIQVGHNSASYSESSGGEIRKYSVVDKL